jgi:luciferase family oxidoreductase group 1
MAYFQPAEPGQIVRAVPGAGLTMPLWILGSSLFGAELAAVLGLPYAFASHFAPAHMVQAIELYRSRFEPSAALDRPYVMLGYNVFAAESDDEARFLASSMQQAFVNLRSGHPTPLPPPIEGYERRLTPPEQAILRQTMSCSAIGSPATVRRTMDDFIARTGADELMITAQMFDPAARLRSFSLTHEAMAAARVASGMT